MKKTDIWMPLYIGDYLADTSRLTTEQHGAYLLLLMDYWRSGKLPDNDQVLSQITKLPIETWLLHKGVLQGFFEVVDGELIHSRVEKELDSSKDRKLSQLKKSILGNYKKYGSIDERVTTDPKLKEWWDDLLPKVSLRESPNVPSSPSPSPSYKTIIKDKATKVACPSDVDIQVWNDWLQLRKTKKASVTQTVINGARKEAEKAQLTLEDFLKIWCLRGSQGLEASWLKPEEKKIYKTQSDKTKDVLKGLTRGLLGGENDVKLLGK